MENIDNHDLSLYYQLANLFVMPSVNLAGDVEGFGIVYLEAALFGLPAVAGKSGGVMEAVIDNETGLLVEPNNQADLIAKISRLLSDQILYEKLAIQAKTRVEQDFKWGKQAHKLADRIHNICITYGQRQKTQYFNV